MKITEKNLLEGFGGISNGMYCISIVKGAKIYWSYRQDRRSRTDGAEPQCRPERADKITLEGDRRGSIELDSDSLAVVREGRARIDAELEKALGASI